MKKKILFLGLMISVMFMFSSCLLVFGEDGWGSGTDYGYDTSKDVTIKNDITSERAKIARVYYKKHGTSLSGPNDWETGYSDGLHYDDPYANERFARNQSVSFDLESYYSSGYYDIQVLIIYPDSGSANSDGQYEFRQADNVYISTYYDSNVFYLEDDFYIVR